MHSLPFPSVPLHIPSSLHVARTLLVAALMPVAHPNEWVELCSGTPRRKAAALLSSAEEVRSPDS
eukprot:4427179-Pleurochrysis_carterae.AAC.1